MDKEVLIDGYKKVINEIYGGNEYYNRVLDFIQRFTPNRNNKLNLILITLLHSLAHFSG